MKLHSVTTILSPYADFSGIKPEVLANAAARGDRVHQACAAYALDFPVDGLEDEDVGYFESFRVWFDATVDEVISVETDHRDNVYHFCGHPDLVCVLKGDSRVCVVDLKTPRTTSKSWRLQLAAYAWLTKAHRCFSLRLSPDKKPAIVNENTDWIHDFTIFCNALAVWRYFND